VFESDEEDQADMPVSYVTGPSFNEKEKEENLPIYFKLKK